MTALDSSDTVSSDSTSLILKTDVRGRVLTPRTRREELMAQFDRSGLSAKSFAELCGVKYQTFAGWLHCRRKAMSSESPTQKASQKVAWLEAVVGQAQAAGTGTTVGLVLQLPGGVRAELTSHHHIHLAAALVRALEKPC